MATQAYTTNLEQKQSKITPARHVQFEENLHQKIEYENEKSHECDYRLDNSKKSSLLDDLLETQPYDEVEESKNNKVNELNLLETQPYEVDDENIHNSKNPIEKESKIVAEESLPCNKDQDKIEQKQSVVDNANNDKGNAATVEATLPYSLDDEEQPAETHGEVVSNIPYLIETQAYDNESEDESHDNQPSGETENISLKSQQDTDSKDVVKDDEIPDTQAYCCEDDSETDDEASTAGPSDLHEMKEEKENDSGRLYMEMFCLAGEKII